MLVYSLAAPATVLKYYRKNILKVILSRDKAYCN